ncbi:NDR1/HIN1-like protein 1 [Prosopis cineraria]|uniref:NDR1/HIN1-like protein 1 n=1 Tax=Prosopis cineraria TaxID=364024 RepID=UPI0024108594|nr:NDR1/HIN1-like protein 1 [Prosopis cineraria]
MFQDRCCDDDERRQLIRRILIGILALTGLILFIIILILIILRPTKPRFTLQDAALYALNSNESPFPTLNLTMQATFSAQNPNDRIGVFYRSLEVYVTYRDQQVSLTVLLPPAYQDHHDITFWSPYLYGISVTVPPYAVDALQQDKNAGAVMLKVVVEGRVKWKVGSWVSGTYHLHVNCPAYIRLAGSRINGIQSCGVDV